MIFAIIIKLLWKSNLISFETFKIQKKKAKVDAKAFQNLIYIM
jgi:hypothetical protein